MPIAASFGKTWDAVIDVFAVKNIPIRTLERVSGLIAAEPLSVEGVAEGKEHPWADCGSTVVHVKKFPVQPNSAFYNVRVKGDSTNSSVLVTVLWKHIPYGDLPSTTCNTKGIWETDVESEIKQMAEADRGGFRTAPIREPAPQKHTTPSSGAIQPTATAVIGAPSSESERAAAVRTFAQAKSYLGNHDWMRAEQSLRETLRHDGSVAEYHAALGSLMMTLRRWDEAEAEFGAASLLDIDNAEYRRQVKAARAKR
jgi:hypothetical protein